eukprot:2134959-Amphidinium_carterae.1
MLEKWAHGVDVTFLKNPDKSALESLRKADSALAPSPAVQQDDKDAAALAAAQGIQLQQLVDDMTSLRSSCSQLLAGSASGENISSCVAPPTPHAEVGAITQDIRKLW